MAVLGSQGRKPVLEWAASYQCFAQTPSSGLGPAGHESMASSKSIPSRPHSSVSAARGSLRSTVASSTTGSSPASMIESSSSTCTSRPVSASVASSSRTANEASISVGSRTSRMLRHSPRKARSRSTMWWAICLKNTTGVS